MPTLKPSDFPDKAAFLTQLATSLAQGTASPAVRDLLALANENKEWWPEAEDLYKRRRDFEALIGAPNSGPALTDGMKGLPREKISWLVMVAAPVWQRVGPMIASSRTQGVLIGLVASILGYLGISFSSSSKPGATPATAQPGVVQPLTGDPGSGIANSVKPEAIIAAIADRVASDPKIKGLAADAVTEIVKKAELNGLRAASLDRIAAEARLSDVSADATRAIVTAARPEGLVADASARILLQAKADTIPAEVANRVEAVVRAPAFTNAVTAKVEETLRSEAMTRAVADEVARQVGALDLPKGVFDKLMASDDFFKKIATEVKK